MERRRIALGLIASAAGILIASATEAAPTAKPAGTSGSAGGTTNGSSPAAGAPAQGSVMCPITIISKEAKIPESLAAAGADPRIEVSVRNDSLAVVHNFTLAAEFEVVTKTVSGDRADTKILKLDHSTFRTPKKVPGDVIELKFGLDELKTFVSAKLKSITVDTASFDSGATCSSGKITLASKCTLPVAKSFVQKNLMDLVCSLDTSLDKSQRSGATDALNARLHAETKGQPDLCPESEVRALALLDGGPSLQNALKQALPRCPGVVGSVISAPLVWKSWPCPSCMEACTGEETQAAIDSNMMPNAVGSYRQCIAACSAKCDPATTAQVKRMSDSDRAYNWPPTDASKLAATTNLLGIDLREPASRSLASFAATSANFDAVCKDATTKCFDLKWTGSGAGPRAEKIRAAVKNDKVVLLAFDLGYGDHSDPRVWRKSLEKQFGTPLARYYSIDTASQSTAFGAGQRRNYVLGRWKAEGGVIDANLLDFAPGSGEGRDTEIIFVAK